MRIEPIETVQKNRLFMIIWVQFLAKGGWSGWIDSEKVKIETELRNKVLFHVWDHSQLLTNYSRVGVRTISVMLTLVSPGSAKWRCCTRGRCDSWSEEWKPCWSDVGSRALAELWTVKLRRGFSGKLRPVDGVDCWVVKSGSGELGLWASWSLCMSTSE